MEGVEQMRRDEMISTQQLQHFYYLVISLHIIHFNHDTPRGSSF